MKCGKRHSRDECSSSESFLSHKKTCPNPPSHHESVVCSPTRRRENSANIVPGSPAPYTVDADSLNRGVHFPSPPPTPPLRPRRPFRLVKHQGFLGGICNEAEQASNGVAQIDYGSYCHEAAPLSCIVSPRSSRPAPYVYRTPSPGPAPLVFDKSPSDFQTRADSPPRQPVSVLYSIAVYESPEPSKADTTSQYAGAHGTILPAGTCASQCDLPAPHLPQHTADENISESLMSLGCRSGYRILQCSEVPANALSYQEQGASRVLGFDQCCVLAVFRPSLSHSGADESCVPEA